MDLALMFIAGILIAWLIKNRFHKGECNKCNKELIADLERLAQKAKRRKL